MKIASPKTILAKNHPQATPEKHLSCPSLTLSMKGGPTILAALSLVLLILFLSGCTGFTDRPYCGNLTCEKGNGEDNKNSPNYCPSDCSGEQLPTKTGIGKQGIDPKMAVNEIPGRAADSATGRQPNDAALDKKLCYFELVIKERKAGDSSEFSLVGLSNLYDDYSNFAREYYQDNSTGFLLQTIGASGNILKQYELPSSRFIIEEDFSKPEIEGIVTELDEAESSIILPYMESISSIKIYAGGKTTDLGVRATDLKCERTCKIEGEEIDLKNQKCCPGFTPSDTREKYYCTNCGNGICSEFENKYFCPEDCKT